MPPSFTPTGWLGAQPVSKDGFAFGNGIFFADVSGHNRHPRASQAEVKAHFKSGDARDHPAHWFEAQLIHYGLAPSKTKSVARMRLLDAANANKLNVPTHLAKLESELKKEWTKLDREAKKAAQTVTSIESATPAASASKGKRKAEEAVVADRSSIGKKAKKGSSAAQMSRATNSEDVSGSSSRPTSSARRGGIHQGPSRSSAATPAPPSMPARSSLPPRSARRSKPFLPPAGRIPNPGRLPAASPPPPLEPSRPARTKQTARRSKPFNPRGRIPSPSRGHYGEHAEDDHERFPEHLSDYDYPQPYDSLDDGLGSDLDRPGYSDPDVKLEALGLLNGDYFIDSPGVTDEWPHLGSDFNLVLTLSRSEIWGRFDLGIIEGVLHFRERPWTSSHEEIPFTWRGQEHEGPISYGNNNHGWIRFLGGGRIEGEFDFMGIRFSGERCPDQGTTSSARVQDLASEWDEYSEARYDRENRAQWN